MTVVIENCWTYLRDLPLFVIGNISKKLTIDTSGIKQEFSEGRMRWVWKKSEFCSVKESEPGVWKLPTGLFWEIYDRLPISTEILDERTNRIDHCDSPDAVCRALGIEVRDYQLEAVASLHHSQRGIMNIATNGGKTEIIAMILLSYPKCCSFVVTSEITGLLELSERFQLRKLEHNIIDSQNKEIDLTGINVCSLDSVRRLSDFKKLLSTAAILIWDECDDSSTAVSGVDIGEKCNAFIRVYLSGTPFTDDKVHNLKLKGYSGTEIVRIPNKYLIDRGFSAKPEVIFHSSTVAQEAIQELRNHSSLLTYAKARKILINENERFSVKIAEEVEKVKDQGVVVLYEHKKHGKLLEDKLKDRGLRPFRIDGSSPKEIRDQAKQDLVAGHIDVILASSIWNRSLDFGFPQHWFFVGGMKASNRIKQRYGRALRKKPNELNKVWIHEWYIFGHDALERHSSIRYYICRNEQFDVSFADPYLESFIMTEEQLNRPPKKRKTKYMDEHVEDLLKRCLSEYGL